MNMTVRKSILVVLVGCMSSAYAMDSAKSSLSGLAEEVQNTAKEHPYLTAGILLFSGMCFLGILKKWMKDDYTGKDGKRLSFEDRLDKQEHEAKKEMKKGLKGLAKISAFFENMFRSPAQKIEDGVDYYNKCRKRYTEGTPANPK